MRTRVPRIRHLRRRSSNTAIQRWRRNAMRHMHHPRLEEEPSQPRSERRSPIRVALQAAALIFVGGLLGLLVYRVIESSRGSNLVAAIRAHKKPVAPDFHHKVIWPHFENWPRALQTLSTREAPRLNASAASHRGQVAFLGVDINDFSTDAVRFLRRHHVNYVSVRARGTSTYEDYGLTGLPETYFLDARGRIVSHTTGEITPPGLQDGITQLLQLGR